jgi:hypothetical protein
MNKFLVALSVAVGLVSSSAKADVVVYSDSLVDGAGVSGLQNWSGRLGMDFTVVKSVLVTALGAFDNGNTAQLDGVNQTGVDVGIFDVSTGHLVGTSVHFDVTHAGLQVGADAFQSVTGFVLGPGNYSIVALNDRNYNQGFLGGNTNQYQTLNDVNGSILFGGPSRFDGNAVTLGLPGTGDGPPVDRYDAGTFMASAVPEPATWLMMIVGFMGLGYLTRRRRNQFAVA